jgi:NADPH:quinone reductase-like Zn-dependent oxidoreductase
MQAIARDTYGPADGLELRTIDRPEIGGGEVLIRVHAAGVDRGVWHIMTGLPYPIRLAGYGLRAPRIPVPGADVAGVVESIGGDVTRFAPGDEVFGIGVGAFAQYARAREDKLATKPVNLTFRQAAAVGISGTTALQALRDHAHVQAGQSVLIVGASGGVGSYAVQLAKAFGAEVTAVCSTSKVEMVRSLGADHVIDYTKVDFTAGKEQYDLILDNVSNRGLLELRRVLKPTGHLVIVGAEKGNWIGPLMPVIRASIVGPFVDQKMGFFIARLEPADLKLVGDLMQAGEVTAVIDRRYAFEEAPQAMEYLETGRARGKVIVNIQ